jgi:hypothetical protein
MSSDSLLLWTVSEGGVPVESAIPASIRSFDFCIAGFALNFKHAHLGNRAFRLRQFERYGRTYVTICHRNVRA